LDFAAVPCFQLRAEAEKPSRPKVKRGLLSISFHPQHPVFATLNTRNRGLPASSRKLLPYSHLVQPMLCSSIRYTSPYPPALHPAPLQRTAPNHSYIGLLLLPSRRNNLLVACPNTSSSIDLLISSSLLCVRHSSQSIYFPT
jgi:hypothetical protein